MSTSSFEDNETRPYPDLDPGGPDVPEPVDEPEGDRFRLSVMHLVMGLVFLGIAGSWALREADVIGPVDVEWLMPLILVVAGAAGLLASVVKNLTGRSDTPR